MGRLSQTLTGNFSIPIRNRISKDIKHSGIKNLSIKDFDDWYQKFLEYRKNHGCINHNLQSIVAFYCNGLEINKAYAYEKRLLNQTG